MYLGYECVNYHEYGMKCGEHCKLAISAQLAGMRENNLDLAYKLLHESRRNPFRRRRNRKIAEQIIDNCRFSYELNLGPY